MNHRLKNGLQAALAAALAALIGWQTGNADLMLPGLVCGVMAVWVFARVTGIPPDTALGGLLLIGYIVGNRGFAQLSLPGVPLLVGEFTLGVGLLLAAWRTALAKSPPVRRDRLNFFLSAWLVLGCLRLPFDFATHGVAALRDSALAYYALFFFFAQTWGAAARQRRWLERCLDTAFALAPPVFVAFVQRPDFFTGALTVGGAPLIYMKSDVQSGTLVAGAIWFLHRHATSGCRWWLALAAANLFAMVHGNSRAGLIALAAVTVALVLTRDRQILRPLCLIISAGLLAMTATSAILPGHWEQTPAHRLYEWALSISDIEGARTYAAANLDDKPDNNRFRIIWWRSVVERAWTDSPWIGLGFGYDLAQDFRQSYYGNIGEEEFSARSPHNFALTVFGRLGLAGLILLGGVISGLAALIWGNRARGAQVCHGYQNFALGLGALAILVSAFFGVVLEGPMGATLFWTALGLANSQAKKVKEPAPETTPSASAATPA